MRAFSLRFPASRFGVASLLLAAAARTASAQYPAELAGRVSDAVSGAPIEAALIEVVGTGLSALSDGTGEYLIRGLEPGRRRVRVTRLGYEPLEREVELRNGQTTWLTARLGVRPMALDEVRAEARREPPAGVLTITRQEIERRGAATAAELLEGRPGVIVQQSGPTGAASASLRGSAADEVLVLLDGAPINDPLTGAADLSSIPASQIESITVLAGARAATLGPGATAGAVLISSRTSAAAPLDFAIETGSLGLWSGSAEAADRALGLDWSAGGQARRLDGLFEYERPAELGGGTATRENADLTEGAAFAAASAAVAGGPLVLRAGYSQLERGIPGPVWLPTPAAREQLTRWRAQAAWERQRGGGRLSAHLDGVVQTARFLDAEPPAGLPYDSRTDARIAGGAVTAELAPGSGVEALSLGLAGRLQSYESDAFSADAPGSRFDFGIFAGAASADFALPGRPRLAAALRLDRDGLDGLWRLTHELSLGAHAGPAALELRHASSYSPPSFGDQFFREGVAVAPNPDLRAERVPAELDASLAIAGRLGSTALARVSVAGYVADVKDMILWAPDFRFVWSPRNFDVKRRGLDASAELAFPTAGLELRAAYSLARATYDRPGDADTVQIIYRPRHSGSIGAAWRSAGWDIEVDARYIGTRYPVPAPLNPLPPFWTIDLRLRKSFAAGGWIITPALAVDRLLDNEDSLIFGYPEPGRVLRLEIGTQPQTSP